MRNFDQEIMDQLKDAMRSKDQLRVETLRAMKSALKYKSVEKSQQALTEAEVYSVFQTLLKQRREAVEQYESAGMADKAAKEKSEMEVISSFLPQPLSETELRTMVKEAITTVGAKEPKDMGKVMKELSPKTAGRADGKTLSDIVRQELAANA